MKDDIGRLQEACRDVFVALTDKQQDLKQVLSVFKQFMLLRNQGPVDREKYLEYKEFISGKIEDTLAFETQAAKMIDKPLGKKLERHPEGGRPSKHRLGCDIAEDYSSENFSNLELSKISGSNRVFSPPP